MPDDDAAAVLGRLHQLALDLGRLPGLEERLQSIVGAAAGPGGKGLLSLYRAPGGGLEVAASCGIEAARAADLTTLHTTVVRSRTGQVLGLLSIHVEGTGATPVEVQLIEICAQHVAMLIELASMQDRLNALHRREAERLGKISDELRSRLKPIRGAVQLLALAAPADSRAAEARAIVDRQAQHLARLLDDLPELA